MSGRGGVSALLLHESILKDEGRAMGWLMLGAVFRAAHDSSKAVRMWMGEVKGGK